MVEGCTGRIIAVIHRNYIGDGSSGLLEANVGNDWSKEACKEHSSKEVQLG
jgi:hypothetical protein